MMMRLLILIVSAFMLVSQPVFSEEKAQYLLTEKTYKQLEAAQALMAEDKNALAEVKLKALIKSTDANSYDRAVVQQTLGYLYSADGNYTKASEQFKLALDSKALPDEVSHDLRYNLAQLLIADEQYKAGIALLEQWIKVEPSPPNSARVLLATAYYRIQNYKNTITYIKAAIANDAKPQESWYQILFSAYLELKHYKSAINVLETLVSLYPYKKAYWDQLGALYLQQSKEFSALAVKTLAQRLELGDSKTVMSLAQMYRYLNIPYKSAQILTKAIDQGVIPSNEENLMRIADSWLAAREIETAATVLEQITKMSDDGEHDLKYSRVLFSLERWEQALPPLTKSSETLVGNKQGQALLLLGMANYHLGSLEQAKRFFTKTLSFKQQRNQASQWIAHIDRTRALKAEKDGV
jgi:tetratricopeptide (TPR) repeat protein